MLGSSNLNYLNREVCRPSLLVQVMHRAYGGKLELLSSSGAALRALFVAGGGTVLTIAAFLYTCIVKSEYFGSEDNDTSILVKSEKKHFELLWLVASKLITGARAIEDFIPGFTANKIDEMSAAVDAHLAGVVTSGREATSSRFLVTPAGEGGAVGDAAAAVVGAAADFE